jgi:repressor of nif and glnA expression
MFLHEAITQVLKEQNRPMTARELADEINQRKLYIKRDESNIKTSQIHARVKNYPHLFQKRNGLIGLKEE